jgi:nicotinamidase-related amidase
MSTATPATALLVIDVQVDLIEGDEPVYDGPAVVARIRRLIDRARADHAPVIFVQDKDVAPVESDGWQIHPALGATPDDLSVRKAYADSFYQTELHEALAARGVRRLVICGCTTDQCVAMTARRAVSLGYDVVLVADGHTTRDNRFLSAPQSIAYHNIVLDGFGAEDGFGAGEHEIIVQPADEVALAMAD